MENDFSALNLLVVDDESFILNLSVRILNNLGCTNIQTAEHGSAALELLSSTQEMFDIIICDLNMPEMDGIEFMRHVSEKDFTGGMILLSGEDERMLETARNLAKAHSLNILGAIPKPLKPDALKPLIDFYKPASNEKRTYTPQTPISEDELREGMEGEGLELVYQPKVRISDGIITGVETLARWNHVERGILGPGAFIPLAEQSGLIHDLTYAIYKKAMIQQGEWLANGIDIKVSVNISVNSFSMDKFSDYLINTALEQGVDLSKVVIEVTESQVMADAKSCLEIMMKLRMKKMGLSIDDFGTGNSSMEQLKLIPFTELKIDRAFVHGATDDSGARAILESSVTLAKSLKMETVAEGAENREDWDLVESLGVDLVQGYYCAKPMPNDQFLDFLEKWTGPH